MTAPTRLLTIMALATAFMTSAPGAANRLAFTPDDQGGFQFDTGVLKGKLHAAGKSTGLSSVMHLPTGTRLDRSMGLFSPYRLLTSSNRFGTAAWDWPSTATLKPDGAVEVAWPAALGHPFQLLATYRWTVADSLALELAVQGQQALPGFEIFLASYFQPGFSNAQVFVRERPGDNQPGLLAARKELADWLMFPRDDAVKALIQDGRWKLDPNPVQWTLLPALAKPLAVRQDLASGLSAILQSPPADCFAIACPYQTEGHYSMYLSLFGRDLRAGEMARARATLLIRQNVTPEQILKLAGP